MEGIRNKAAWAFVAALSLMLIGALAGVVRGSPLDPTGPPGSTGEKGADQLRLTSRTQVHHAVRQNRTALVRYRPIAVVAEEAQNMDPGGAFRPSRCGNAALRRRPDYRPGAALILAARRTAGR